MQQSKAEISDQILEVQEFPDLPTPENIEPGDNFFFLIFQNSLI